MLTEDEKELTEEELAHWVAFSLLNGVGPKRVQLLDERLGSMVTAWNASPAVLQRMPGFGPETIAAMEQGRKGIDPGKLLQKLKDDNIQVWTLKDSSYPVYLRNIADPPICLFVNGQINFSAFNNVAAVVGTRHPTTYGQKLAKEFARGLSENGVTVISGMAVGIDSLAHWGAIEGGSPTIAVLGCGPDVCYPSSNRKLFKTIVDENKGAIISEYFPGTTPEKFRFPARNRIVSGLSQAVIVVEGGTSSGSLITAKIAFDQSREVFAVPGRVDSPMSEGPHKLIREDRAHICTSHNDVLKEMGWEKVPGKVDGDRPTAVKLYGREKEVYDLVIAEPIHFDTLCERTAMQAGELSATLTMLELAGLLTRLPGDWYERAK
ncbi:MAG: DNA-processing protein DprA [Candidatus Obscuribacterales bacterium]|jgi:DNA processing protein|nr:DNA-processing protein DprA [Candidatus Obscuribacterales bacterium]